MHCRCLNSSCWWRPCQYWQCFPPLKRKLKAWLKAWLLGIIWGAPACSDLHEAGISLVRLIRDPCGPTNQSSDIRASQMAIDICLGRTVRTPVAGHLNCSLVCDWPGQVSHSSIGWHIMTPIHVSRAGASTTSGQFISMFHQPHQKKCLLYNFSKATLF